METWTIGDWVVAGILGLYLLHRIFKMFGWEKGAYVADELRDALQDGREMIRSAQVGREDWNIKRAAETAAAKVKGLDAGDVQPIIEGLVKREADRRYGVDVKIDTEGNVSVDPSGLAGKLANKAGKWFRKIF